MASGRDNKTPTIDNGSMLKLQVGETSDGRRSAVPKGDQVAATCHMTRAARPLAVSAWAARAARAGVAVSARRVGERVSAGATRRRRQRSPTGCPGSPGALRAERLHVSVAASASPARHRGGFFHGILTDVSSSTEVEVLTNVH
ncbi:hypothetical protein ACJJTC_019778 [Scirpophaga incertulas]